MCTFTCVSHSANSIVLETRLVSLWWAILALSASGVGLFNIKVQNIPILSIFFYTSFLYKCRRRELHPKHFDKLGA